MREILFRGKRIDNGEWVCGYYICKQDPLLPGIDTNVIVTFDENSMSVWNKVDPATVGQYTGLTDKNGMKIFEGDILFDEIRVRKDKNNEWIYRRPKYVVLFQDGEFCLKTIYNRVVSKRTCRLSVIGNIYDSPKFFIQGD